MAPPPSITFISQQSSSQHDFPGVFVDVDQPQRPVPVSSEGDEEEATTSAVPTTAELADQSEQVGRVNGGDRTPTNADNDPS